MAIVRGTTPLYSYEIPFLASDIELMFITFVQGAKAIEFRDFPFTAIEKTEIDSLLGGG